MTYGTKFSTQIITTKKSRVFTPSDILSLTMVGKNEAVDPEAQLKATETKPVDLNSSLKPSRLSTVLNTNEEAVSQINKLQTKEQSETICCFPLLKSDDTIMGILEISCKRRRTLPEDVKLLECFSQLVTISLERNALQLIATLGRSEVELKKYINPNERTQIGVIPSKLKITRADSLFKIGFDASSYEGIASFKVLWAIFDYFKLFREFKVKNDLQLEFIQEFKNNREWIFNAGIKNQKLTDDMIRDLRRPRITINRNVICNYKFPICMSIPTFLSIQAQKIFSLYNCPNCKYTWMLFQRYIREMILETWSLFIDKSDKNYRKKKYILIKV